MLPNILVGGVLITTILATGSKRAETTESKIDRYRKDFMSHMLNNIPYTLTSFMLQNSEQALKENDVMFYLYNRKYPHNSIIINKDVRMVNPKWPVKIVVHGWTEHYYVPWARNMTAAYLSKGKYNVIVLDWSKKGDTDYLTASRNVKDVSNFIGDFIVEKLHKGKGIPLKRIHLISHSLGSHVAGLVGQRVLKQAGQKLARITALDPAAPIFDMFTFGNEDRLSPDDANFVDIIHTDGGMLGFKQPIGIVDFFPNGGTAIQPGCPFVKSDIKYEDWWNTSHLCASIPCPRGGLNVFSRCTFGNAVQFLHIPNSHASSHRMFLRSILNSRMKATPCDSWDRYAQGQCDGSYSVPFGEETPYNISGKYFLNTPEDIIAHPMKIN